jgi:RHS repeat-associated protein
MKSIYTISGIIRHLILVPLFLTSVSAYSETIGSTVRYYYYAGVEPRLMNDSWAVSNNKGVVVYYGREKDIQTLEWTHYADIRWDLPGSAVVTFSNNGVAIQTYNVTVVCNALPQPTFTATPGQTICGAGQVTITATPGSGADNVKWYNVASGGTALATATQYVPTVSATTTYYIASFNTTTLCEGTRKAVTITVNTVPGTATTGAFPSRCGTGSITLTATAGSNGNSLRWYDANQNLLSNTGTSYNVTLPETTSFYVSTYQTTTGCTSPVKVLVQGIVNIIPTKPVDVTDEWIYSTGTAKLSIALGPDASTGNWYTSSVATGTPVASGASYTTASISATQIYYTRATTAAGCLSDTTWVYARVITDLVSPSNVKTDIVRKEGTTSLTQIDGLSSSEKTTQYNYLDGIGRTVQAVVTQASPAGNDIVRPFEYDAQGRASKQFMPYVAAATTGVFRSAYRTEQPAFYAASNDKIANDVNPYAVAVFEGSPINRITEKGSNGQAWQPGTSHTLRVKYSYNTGATASEAEEVRLFKPDGSSAQFYAANKLERVESTNPNGNKEITYVNTEGLVLAKKTQLDETVDGVTVSYLETYYIYDESKRLKYIISPKGVSILKANGWSLSTILDQYVYQFVYDSRGRLIEKKNPGKAWLYYIYDKLDRLVLVQDGQIRTQNKWIFTKYDVKGNAIVSGLYTNTTQASRSALQILVDKLYKASNALFPESAYFEKRGTTLHGYTNQSFPKTNADNSALEILTVNYFGSHDFDFNGSRDFKYDSLTLSGQSAASNWQAKGLLTGTKSIVLGTSTWLYTYVFYDKYSRAIQRRSNNHLSTTVDNLETVVYDFEGKVLKVKNYHNAGSGRVTTVVNNYEYDPSGRVKKIYQNNDSAPSDQLVSQYEYNELGQLVDKKLHTTSGTSFLQSVDYRYNIRGWITCINNAQLNINGTNNDESNDYFGMEFLYNTAESGLGNSLYYNGNVSAIKWKGIGAVSGTTDQKSYKFGYDKANKLETATSQLYTGSAWTKEAGAVNETMAYDHNGNIKTLQRNQRKHQLSGTIASYTNETIDNLTYDYSTSYTDQLQRVTDAATVAGGFGNGSSGTSNDYTYDVNGNMLSDANKGISSTTYNLLGKPSQVNFSDGKKIDYLYDATGNKLQVKTWQGTTLLNTSDYVGTFVYENNTLSFFASPEGRVVKNGTALEYQYGIADQQGNTRVVFTSVTPAVDAPIATFEGDANDGTSQYTIPSASNIVSFGNANHTIGGSKVLRMNQTYKIGAAKSLRVYPGDKVDIEVWEYHEGISGFGTSTTPLTTLITAVAGTFGGVSGGAGESGFIYNGVNSALTAFGVGGNQGDAQPAAYLNYILFDKDYKVLDAGWQLAPATTFTKQKLSFPQLAIKEVGYIYVYLSYDNSSNNWVYFDDFKVTHTKSNVLQYNEYYPFGLQANTSWTRTESSNKFLYNAGNELNTNTGLYEMYFRNYDPSIGRMTQIDPYAMLYSSSTPYNYSLNNPTNLNDPTGAYTTEWQTEQEQLAAATNGGGGWSFDFSGKPMISAPFSWGMADGSMAGTPGSGNHYSDKSFNGFGKSAGEFIDQALASQNGGTWSNGTHHFYTNLESRYAISTLGYWEGVVRGFYEADGTVGIEQGKRFVLFEQDPNEFEIVNKKYLSSFYNQFVIVTGSAPDIEMWTNKDAVAFLKQYMMMGSKYNLSDEEGEYPELMPVGYEIFDERDAGEATQTLYEIVPKDGWMKPIYENPGDINPNTGIAQPIWFPTKDGTVGLKVYFQYVPNM